MSSTTPPTTLVRTVCLLGVLALLMVPLASFPTGRVRQTAAQAAPGCVGWTNGGVTYTTRRMQYTSDGVLHLVGCGEIFTLTDIRNAIGTSAIFGTEPTNTVQLVDPAAKTWMLNVKLQVEEGATLNLIGGSGDVNWLRLKSGTAGISWIKAINSTLTIRDTHVSSWDPATGTYDYTNAGAPGNDETPGGGTKPRAFVAARSNLAPGRAWTAPTACGVNGGTRDAYEARMDVSNSTVDYLGYNGAEAYGMSWKVYSTDASLLPPNSRDLYKRADVFGTISNSIFSQNYFGSYMYGGYCMSVTDSDYLDNYYYGLDPHDDTDFMTVSGNRFERNAGHGFICSVYCNDLVLTGNQALNNGKHGLMIHREVNGAVIENNVSSGNGDTGLAIFDSYDAVVRNNTIENNGVSAVRLSVGASNNLVEGNTLTGPPAAAAGPGHVIYSFMGSDLPTIRENRRITSNTFRDNTVTGSKSPVVKFSDATGNVFEGNRITGGPSLTTFEFRDGVGNVVRANVPSGTTTVNTVRSAPSQPLASVILSESPIGRSIVVRNTPSGDASTTVRDSRSYVWQGSSVTAAPGGTSSTLAAESTTITPLDFVVDPDANAVTVTVASWSTAAPYTKSWLEAAPTNPGRVRHQVGNLLAGACYEVKADTTSLGGFVATGSGSSGRISFTFAGQYPETTAIAFTVSASTTACAAVSPTSTPSATATRTATPTATASATATPTATRTATSKATMTATPVAGPATIRLSLEKAKFNAVVTASLTGFTANSVVTVTWQDGTTLAQVSTAPNGTASATFRAPLSPYGDYRVDARDASGRTARTQLRIIPRVNLAPTRGDAGSTTRVYLYGYAAGERVDVQWYETETSFDVLTTLTIPSNGRASSVVTVPSNASLGDHKVAGKVVGIARSASLPFTVTGGGAGVAEQRSASQDAAVSTASPSPTATVALPTPALPTMAASLTPTTVPTTTALPTVTVTSTPSASATASPTELVEVSVTATPTDTVAEPAEPPAAATEEPPALASSVTEQPSATTTPVASDVLPVVGVRRSASTANGWTALDGDTSTVWGTTIDPPGRLAILTLDLGATVAVGGVRLLVGPEGFSGILTVESSTDGERWTAVADPGPSELSTNTWSSFTFDGPAEARFVRLVVVNPGDLTSLGGVGEIEVVDAN